MTGYREAGMRVAVLCCIALLAASESFAQTDRNGTLLVTVVDETRAVLPGANVTLAGTEAATKTAAARTAATNQQGQATFPNLPPGRYSVAAEFPGFQTRTLPDIRVRTGENKQAVMLPIDRLQSDVTVARDRQAAASDRDVTFGSVMTREQIEALSDDPDELRRQLIDIAGPDAKILVDSFEGRDLPPKALIKSIRITRDQFAPEVHFAGELRIEILTQPGVGPVRGSVRMGFYDSAMDGTNPIVGVRGPAQSLNYGGGLNGTLISQRASFNINFNGTDSYLTPVQVAATPNGQVRQNAAIRSPQDNAFYSGGLDYALTRDQVLRLNFNGSRFVNENTLASNFDSIERAYTSEDSRFGLFLQQNGPLGRRFVLNTRLSVFGNDSTTRSAVEAPTLIVNDAFTIGGAQRRGGTHTRNYWLNSDLDYVRGIHSIRTGVEVQYAQSRTDSDSNYLGTYVFEDLDKYEARLPRSFTRRTGDPNVNYTNVQGGAYIQDDIKVRKGLTVTGGVRYEAQTHVDDLLNFAPRAGITWAPFKSGKTTLRGSWGMFYDWLSTGTYAQTLQLDGFRQRELNVIDPEYPVPGVVGTTPPTNQYLLADDRPMAYSQRLSAGIAQTISRRINTNVLYSYGYRYSLLVGRNLNTPVNGVRPFPEFANVVLASPDSKGSQHYVNASVNINLAPLGPQGGPPGGGGAVMLGGGGRSGDDLHRRSRTGGIDGKALGVAARPDDVRLLQLRAAVRQHGRAICRARDAESLLRVGTVGLRSHAQRQLLDHERGVAQLQRAVLHWRIVCAAADDSHRVRRQRRSDFQRSAGRRQPEFRADDRPVELEHELQLRVHARQQAGDLRWRRADLGRPRGTDGDSDRHADATALPAEPVGRHSEPVQPRGLLGLQRRDELAVLPAADPRRRCPPHQVQRQRQFLSFAEFTC